jgi:hypothetical protein
VSSSGEIQSEIGTLEEIRKPLASSFILLLISMSVGGVRAVAIEWKRRAVDEETRVLGFA